MSSDFLTVYTKVRDLLSDKKRWTKGCWARTENKFNPDNPEYKVGNETSVHDPNANCFCVGGAIIRCGGGYIHGEILYRTQNLSISEFNDLPTTTHDDILALLDAKIAEFKAS